MSLAIRLAVEPVRTLAFGAIGAAYMGVGPSMTRPIRMLLIQNLTDAYMMFSFDGIDDHIPLADQSFVLLDIGSNRGVSQEFSMAQGSRVYVKQFQGAPGSGAVYITTFYGAE
jgi:hypothetical protein